MEMEDSTDEENTCVCDIYEDEKKPLPDEQADRNANDTTSQSTETQKMFCDPCLFDKTEQNAAGFCKNCTEYLCERCIKEHKKAKSTRGHCILEENLPEEPEIFQTMKGIISCDCHPEYSITSQCSEHSKFICSLCIAETHRKCTLYDLKQHGETISATNAMFDKLDDLQLTCETTGLQIKSNKKTLLQQEAKVKSDIDNFVIEVNESVKNLGNASLKELEETTRRRLSDIESDQKYCMMAEEAAVMHRKVLEASIRFGNESDANVLAKVLSERLSKVCEKIKNIAAKKIEEMQFKGDSHLLELQYIGGINLKSEEEESCVTSFIAKSSDEIAEVESEAKQASGIKPSSNEIHDSKFEPIHTTPLVPTSSMDRVFDKTATAQNVKLSGDENPCTVIGIVTLHDGTVVLIDAANSAIKVFDEDFVFSCALKLDDHPTDICVVEDETVALSFLNFKKIDRYSIEDSSVCFDGDFKTRLYNLSIAMYEDKIAILMSDKNLFEEKDSEYDVIEIQFRHPINGQRLFTLENFMDDDFCRNWFLFNPTRIRFNDEEQLLILEESQLTCYQFSYDDNEAGREWYLKTRQNSPEYGLASVASDKDSVYYCSNNGAIGQVSSLNFRNKRFLETNIVCPESVCLDSDRSRLLVGCHGDNYVHVYHFK